MTALNGWIAVPRSVLTAEWYRSADAFTQALWLRLMLSATHKTATTRTGLVLQPGQVVTSYGALAEAMVCRVNGHAGKAHPSKVRRALYFLGKAGEATVRATGQTTYTGIVVTLERWALYASNTAQPTDHATGEATGGLSGGRQDRKNTTGPVGLVKIRQDSEAFAERCRRDADEVAEVRAREGRRRDLQVAASGSPQSGARQGGGAA